MKIYVWIIIALVAAVLIISVCVICYNLVRKLTKNDSRITKHSITVRPKTAKPIDAFEEASAPYTRISGASIIMMPEYQTQKTVTMELRKTRSFDKKFNRKSDTLPSYTISSRSKRRSEHFVDRDPPSDESQCDYLNPLDLDLSRLHDIYTANNKNLSK